jgi:hypothetical protein
MVGSFTQIEYDILKRNSSFSEGNLLFKHNSDLCLGMTASSKPEFGFDQRSFPP